MAQWFRMYDEIINDAKIRRIARITKLPKATIIGAWTILLTYASASPERGTLLIADDIPITIDDMIDDFGVGEKRAKSLVEAFLKFNMLALTDDIYNIPNWGKRQFKSDDTYARVKKHRKKRNKETEMKRFRNVSETEMKRFRNGNETPPETESETESESESESEYGGGDEAFKMMDLGAIKLDYYRNISKNLDAALTQKWIDNAHNIPDTWGSGKIHNMIRDGISHPTSAFHNMPNIALEKQTLDERIEQISQQLVAYNGWLIGVNFVIDDDAKMVSIVAPSAERKEVLQARLSEKIQSAVARVVPQYKCKITV